MPLYYYSMWRLRQGLNTEQTDTQTNKERGGGVHSGLILHA